MAPIALKVKGNKTFSTLSSLSSEDELSHTWRICTRVKDSLENGSRLENLSWRLWYRQHTGSQEKRSFKKLPTTISRQLNTLSKIEPVYKVAPPAPCLKMEEGQPYMEQLLLDQPLLDCFLPPEQSQPPEEYNTFNTNAEANMVLDDIFSAFNNGFQLPNNHESHTTADMGMADGWDFGYPSPTNPYYSPTLTPVSPNTLLQNYEPINENDAMYVSGSSMPPPPVATLRNKLLENQQIRFDHKTPPMSASTSASTIASTNSMA